VRAGANRELTNPNQELEKDQRPRGHSTSSVGVQRIVSRVRSLRRAVFVVFVASILLLLLTLTVSLVAQILLRRRSEQLLTEIQSFEMRQTSWAEARSRLQPWSSNAKIDEHCDANECSLAITPSDLVYPYISSANASQRLDDYVRWRFGLSYNVGPFVRMELAWLRLYMGVGGHPARIQATVGMRDGIVWSKRFSVLIVTHAHIHSALFGEPWDGFYGLIAETRSVSRFDIGSAQLVLHPDYTIGRPGGCEGCVMGWAKFTPYADPADVRRLMQIDLSCLTRWHSCLSQSDVIPAAWAQYIVEGNPPYIQRTQAPCSPAITEMLGRDSAAIAAATILDYRRLVDTNGYPYGLATVRVAEKIKGPTDWTAGEVREVRVFPRSKQEHAELRRGAEIILFGRWDRSDEMRLDPGYGCPLILANESNLTPIRAGIAQDYAAADHPE